MEKEYKMYRGLQKPLVMFGLKGSSIGIGLGSVGVVIIFLILGISMFSVGVGLIMALIPGIIGYSKLRRNSVEGLHRKRKYPGVWVVKQLIKET